MHCRESTYLGVWFRMRRKARHANPEFFPLSVNDWEGRRNVKLLYSPNSPPFLLCACKETDPRLVRKSIEEIIQRIIFACDACIL